MRLGWSHVRQRAVLLLLVAALCFAPPTSAQGAASASEAVVQILDANLEPLGADDSVAGDGAAVFVRVTQPPSAQVPRGLSSVRGVQVRSAHADGSAFDAGWTIDLLETSPGSNQFIGSFRVSPPSSQSASTPRAPSAPALTHPEFGKIFGDGTLRVEAAGKIIVQLGSARAQHAWHPAADGIVAGPEPGTVIRGYGTRLDFRVQDKDLNSNPTTTEQHDRVLRAYSDSSPNGVAVPLVESAAASSAPVAAVNSAVFVGSVSLTDRPDASPELGLLYVQPNERIWAVYEDRTTADGLSAFIDVPEVGEEPWMFLPSTAATVSIGPAHYFLPDRMGGIGGTGDGMYDLPVVLTVADLEPSLGTAAVPFVNVTLRVSDPPQDPEIVPLTTLGQGVGLFQASLTVVRPPEEGGPSDAQLESSPPAAPWARVANGGRIEIAYDDINELGARVATLASTRVHRLGDASFVLGPSATLGRLVGESQSHSLLLADPDADLDPTARDRVTVRVRSTSDVAGIPLTLLEDSDGSGVFYGSVSFAQAASTATQLRVRDSDAIVAEYRDYDPSQAQETLVRSNLVTWRAASDAVVEFDAPFYARQMPASACSWNATARIVVRDADSDDPARIDSVPLTLRDGGATKDLVATETGPHSGVFLAVVPFTKGSACPAAADSFTPSLAAGVNAATRSGNRRTLEAVYFDLHDQSGFPEEVVGRATWIEGDGLAQFETQWDPGAQRRTLLYHDTAADAEFVSFSPVTPGTKTFFAVYSSEVPTGIYATSDRCPNTLRALDFREWPAASGRWVANLSVTIDGATSGGGCVPSTMAGSGTRVRINEVSGRDVVDTVRIVGLPSTSPAASLTIRGVMPWSLRMVGGGAEAAAGSALAVGDRAGIRAELIASGANEDIERFDITSISAYAASPANGNTVRVDVVETSPDSDTFVGSVALRDGAGLGGAPVTSSDPEGLVSAGLRSAPHARVCFWDSGNAVGIENNPDAYADNDTYEPLYLKKGNTCGSVQAGDIRLTGSGGILTQATAVGEGPSSPSAAAYDFYAGGTIVRSHDLDVGRSSIDTWGDHYNGTGRVVPNPTGSRFGFVDKDADATWDEGERVYLDLDGSGGVSVNDVRISSNTPDGRNGHLPAFSRVAVGSIDCVGLGTGAQTCGLSEALRPLSFARLAYLDVDGDAAFADRDALYLERGAIGTGDRLTGAGDLRVTGLGDLAGRTIPILVASSPNGERFGAAIRATLPTTVVALADANPNVVGSVRWVPGRVAQVIGTPGYGDLVRPQLTIRDDVAAEYRDDLQITGNGGASYRPPEAPRPDTTLVFVTATERVPQDQMGSAPGTDTYVVRAQGRAAQGIADADGDGRLTCADLLISSGATCTSSASDLLNGIVRYACNTNTCTFQLNYLYRAATVNQFADDCGDCDAYHAVVGPDGKINFGAAVPDGQRIRLHFRPSQILLPVTSSQTQSTFHASFQLVSDATGGLSYTGQIPVSRTGTSGLHVKPGPGARDELRVEYADRRTPADVMRVGDPAGLLSATGVTAWLASEAAVIRFGPDGSIDHVTGSTSGPLVPIQVRDADSDASDRPDTLLLSIRNLHEPRDTVQVTARETGAHTGVFHATVPVVQVPFVPNAPGTNTALHMPSGDGMFIVAYADPHGSDGSPASVSAAVRWRAATTGRIVVGATSALLGSGGLVTPPAQVVLRGSEAALYMAVQDTDRNTNSFIIESIPVRVTSADDPVGEVVRLVETGLATGTFLSPGIRFEAHPTPENGRIFVRDGSSNGNIIRVVYEDPLNQDGLHQYTEPTSVVRWKRTYDGVVRFDQSFYVGTKADAASGTIRFGGAYVEDGDLNTDPTIVDRPAAKVLVGRPGSGGRLEPGKPVQLRLFETHANSGVFLGRFSFTTASGDAPVAEGEITSQAGQTAQVPMAAVGLGGVIYAEYLDPEDSRGSAVGSNVTFSAASQWYAAGVGVLRLDRPGYNDYANVVRVTLIDKDLDTSASPDKATVTLRSSIEPGGVKLELLEDGNRTGAFFGSIGLDPVGSAPGTIRVRESDVLQASYGDAFPAATRTATARIGIGDHTSASTTALTAPRTPTGLRGAFLEPILVNLSANRPVEAILYRLGAAGANQTYATPIRLGEGVHLLAFWSVDAFGNVETVRHATFVVDLKAPTEPIRELVGQPGLAGSAHLTWSAVPDAGDPLEFYDYLVFRDENLGQPIANTTTASFVDRNLTGEGAHAYRVLARDFAGRRGPLSAPISVTVDAVAPAVSQVAARPATFDLRQRPGGLDVTATVTDSRLEDVNAALLFADGTILVSAPMQRALGSTHRATLDVSNLTEPCLCQLRIEASDEAGNNGTSTQRYLITGDDKTPPRIGWGNASDPSVPRGTPVHVSVSDNVGLTSVRYFLDGGPATSVAVPPLIDRFSFTIPTGSLATGPHNLTVVAADNALDAAGRPVANTHTQQLSFTVVNGVPGGAGGLVPSGFVLPTEARRRPDGLVQVTWLVPTDASTPSWLGYQVWRSSSPYRLVANVTDATAREYVDVAAVANGKYRYLVTGFTAESGLFATLDQVPGYSEATGSQLEAKIADQGSGIEAWVWTLVAAVSILVVALVVALTVTGRRSAPRVRSVGQVGRPVAAATASGATSASPASARPARSVSPRSPRAKALPAARPRSAIKEDAATEPDGARAQESSGSPVAEPSAEPERLPLPSEAPSFSDAGETELVAPDPGVAAMTSPTHAEGEPDEPNIESDAALVIRCGRCGATFGTNEPPPVRVQCPTCGKKGKIR